MYRNPLMLSLILLLHVIVFQSFSQSIPQKISFQGKLLESGSAVTGTRNFVFSFNGTAWTETHADVQVTNGLYSVVLGTVSPIPVSVFNEHTTATLHIVVEGTALVPDIEVGATGYAFKAEKADDVSKIAGTTVDPISPSTNQILKFNGTSWSPAASDWSASGNNLYNSNSGNVIVGPGSSMGKLSVFGTATSGNGLYSTTSATSSGTHALYAVHQSNTSGFSNAINGTLNGVTGYAYWGYPYHYGVAGYRYDDAYGNSGGVYGAISDQSNPTAYGVLGYQDLQLAEWGGYFHGNVFTDGQLKITGGSPGAGKVLTSDANGLASWQTPATSAQWLTSGSNIYFNTGNVGIGTSTPQGKLQIIGSDAFNNSRTLEVENTSTSAAVDNVSGIYGKINITSTSGTNVGVYGISANTAGNGMGVFGESNGEYGYGVYAKASSNSQYSTALMAHTNSANGYCAYFLGGKNSFTGKTGIGSTPPTGPAYMLHVVGTDDNASGRVLEAENQSTSTNANISAIYGKINTTAGSTSGAGVFGYSAATTGGGIGVKGHTASETGRGLMGYATHGTGVNYAIYGQTSSANGYAGYFYGGKNYFQGNVGIGTDSPDYKLSVLSSSSAAGNRILDVENTSTSAAQNMGVLKSTINTTAVTNPGSAIHGLSASSTGGGIGVKGETAGATGKALSGLATSATGINYAIYGSTSSSDGYAGYFAGGKNYFEGKVGIGNSAPDESLVVGSSLYEAWAIPAISCGDATNGGAIEVVSSTVRYTMQVHPLLNYSSVSASNASGFGQGNLIYNVDRIGIGNNVPVAKLHVENAGSIKAAYIKGTGPSLTHPALMVENSGASGVAAYLKTYGTDATLVLGQNEGATGALLKGFGPNGGTEEIRIDGDGTTTIYNGDHIRTIHVDPSASGTDGGSKITLYDGSGVAKITLNANDAAANGLITTGELEITGGADLAEPFDVENIDEIEPGTILCIDPENAGKLKISDCAYNRLVAGVVSGAHDIKPGLVLKQKGTKADGKHLVALTGRVYCQADANTAPIKPGDFLTTSSIPGLAMKAVDHEKAQGAIIGKAMTGLDSGQGLVLVLVTLQ